MFTSSRAETRIHVPDNIKIIAVPFIWTPSKSIHTMEMLLCSFVIVVITMFLKAFLKIDAIYVRDILLAFFLLHVKKLASITIVKIMAFSEEGGRSPFSDAIYNWIAQRIIAKSYKIAAPSSTFALKLRMFNINPEKIIILPPGVDIRTIQQIEPRSTSLSEIRIGFTGYVTDYQGIDILIEAMVGLRQKYPNAVLYVVGDGPALRSARALAGQYQIKAIFTGKITHKDALALLATFDILAIPRRRTETTESVFPIKLLEAMALGVPVIITRHESLDFLSDGRDVIFCEPESNELASKIDLLLCSPVRKQSLIDRGKEISRAFDYEVLAERLVQDLLRCKTN